MDNPYQTPKSRSHEFTVEDNEASRKAKSLATLVYVFQATGLVLILPFVIAAILNYWKIENVKNTWVETHFNWQMNTFSYGIIWTLVSLVAMPFGLLGLISLSLVYSWAMYRVIRGWRSLAKYQLMK